MPSTISILLDPADIQKFTDFYADMENRLRNRQAMVSILLKHLDPLVVSERSYLSSHDKSGALSLSLRARAGSGDRPGTISVFSSPTATVKELQSTWGSLRGRTQQKRWLARMSGKGRRLIRYGNIVALGHKIVKRNAAGDLYEVDRRPVDPIPFAQQAVDSIGDAEAEAAANDVLGYIFGD